MRSSATYFATVLVMLGGMITAAAAQETAVDDELGDEITAVDDELGDEITAVDDELGDEITAVDDELGDEITAVDDELGDEITAVDDELGDEVVQDRPEFVEEGVDYSIYIERYLTESEFATWYDTYYPDLSFYDALQITEAEYNEIVLQLLNPQCGINEDLVDGKCVKTSAMCGPGTIRVDNSCVVEESDAITTTSNSDKLRTQGEGLQLGVAAAIGFGAASAIVLLFLIIRKLQMRSAS